MTFNEVLEVIVATMILVIVGITIWPEAKYTEYVVENTEQEFNQHPIVAWKTTHEKWNGKQGDIVKIKYRVVNSDTKLWMYNVETGKLVHQEPMVRNPHKDGTPRDLIYVWKLYKTERSKYIPPGDYDIIRGGGYEPVSQVGKLSYRITI
jgi:hypothetical protein|tara:strand:+ start:1413 stop:1862 length:450 start_codon:yes stop_codon:yes gene_type:complete